MWTRKLLKDNAKLVLRRSYWKMFVLCLVAGLLTGNSGVAVRVSQEQIEDVVYSVGPSLAKLFAIGGLLGSALIIAYTVFAGNVIVVGWKRGMMEYRCGQPPFDTLFSCFGRPGYDNIVKGMWSVEWRVFVWSLLLVIPGIIKSLEYTFVPYLLAENPFMPPARARELSRWMTDGEKWNIVVLHLSFAGWYILGTLCLGLGGVFVKPYEEATMAELYAAMRAKAFANGWSDERELGGFVSY